MPEVALSGRSEGGRANEENVQGKLSLLLIG